MLSNNNNKITFRLIFISISILFIFHIFNDLDLDSQYFVNINAVEIANNYDGKERIDLNYKFDSSEYFEEDNVPQNNNNLNKNNQIKQQQPVEQVYHQVKKEASSNNNNNNNNENDNKNENDNTDKYVILAFDRGYKTTFTKAKPIMDKYDFKATMFVACSRTESSKGMNWEQLRQLQNEGHDIQSHGEEHAKLTDLDTYEEMESIVGEGKECLKEKGFNPTAFQAPYNKGGDDPKIVDIISKYFDFAFTGHAKLMFLNCDGYENFDYGKNNYEGITDCSPYFSDGTPKPTSRYAMKEWSHDREKDDIYESKYEDKNEDPHGKKVREAVLENFIEILERQTEFNKDGEINAIPIVTYHRLDTNKDFDTPTELFEQEMEYLYENDYKVITLSDLGYDDNEQERFYLKNGDNSRNELSQFQNK
jgi:peptidoglycan/xylan/chitin deacetylase (PgdA/CDA1 family)